MASFPKKPDDQAPHSGSRDTLPSTIASPLPMPILKNDDPAFAALLGALIGDAMGVPYEFKPMEDIPDARSLDFVPDTGYPRSHPGIPPGTWSDDGAMLLSLYESLMQKGHLDPHHLAALLLDWERNGRHQMDGKVFDMGGTVRNSLRELAAGTPPLEAGSTNPRFNGNGALVRSLAVAAYAKIFPTTTDIALQAMEQSCLTHRHPVSLVCSGIYATMAYQMMRRFGEPHGQTYLDDMLEAAIADVRDLIGTFPTAEGASLPDASELRFIPMSQEDALAALESFTDFPRNNFLRGSGYVVDTLWSAINAVKRASNYSDAIRNAIRFGNDTDSTACVAGGLAGILWGLSTSPPGQSPEEYVGVPLDWTRQLRIPGLSLETLLNRRDPLTGQIENILEPDRPRVAIGRGDLARYLTSSASETIDALCRNANVAGVSATPFVLVRHPYSGMSLELASAIGARIGGLFVEKTTEEYPEPVPLATIWDRDMPKPSAESLVDLLGNGYPLVMIAEASQRLHPEVGALVSNEITLERFDAESIIRTCQTLFGLDVPVSLTDEPWMAYLRPSDFLLINRRQGASTTNRQYWESLWQSIVERDFLGYLALTHTPSDAAGETMAAVIAALRQIVERRLRQASAAQGPSLSELHGVDAARRWAEDLIEDLRLVAKGPDRGGILWKDVDRGALLVGPPGTGKTTIARAIAKAAGLNFVLASTAVWSGAGKLNDHLRAIQDSFALAAEMAPSILFIDEIDALGSRETLGSSGNDAYVREVITCVLEELDGFESRGQVVVLAATNAASAVDPALRRSGRLDREIPVPYPNASDLALILRYYLADSVHEIDEQQFRSLGRLAVGLTGADIEAIARTARRRARRDGGRAVQAEDVRREVLGLPLESKQRLISQEKLHVLCVHEAGHAVAVLADAKGRETLQHVSVIGSDTRGGFVLSSADDEHRLPVRESLLAFVRACLAGRAAEEMVFGAEGITTGSGGPSENCDLARATRAATAYFDHYAFGPSGSLVWSKDGDGSSPSRLADIEELLKEQYAAARRLLEERRRLFDRLVAILLEDQEITGDDARRLLEEER